MSIMVSIKEVVTNGMALLKTVTGFTKSVVADNSRNFLRISNRGPICGNVDWERKSKIHNRHSEKTINVVLLETTTSRGPLSPVKITKKELRLWLGPKSTKILNCQYRKYPGGNITSRKYKIISSKFVGYQGGGRSGRSDGSDERNVYTIPDDTDNFEVLFDISKERTVSLHEFNSAHNDVYVIVEVQGNSNKRITLNSKNTSAKMRGTRYLISVGEAAPNNSVKVKIE